MNPEKTSTATQRTQDKQERVFTVESANRALVLVRKVVEDLVPRYTELMAMRSQREELAGLPGARERLEGLRVGIERHIEAVNRLHDELVDIGCELKDFSMGLVDFPALHQGRKVWLCWRLGEPLVTHWHELDAGFSGRRPIGPDFT